MPTNFLSNLNTPNFTGILEEHFRLFSSGHWLNVHKEPKKVVSSINADYFAGYGSTSNESNITLVPSSGIFPVVRVFSKESEKIVDQLNLLAPGGTARIKVERNARDFIIDGKNEYIEMDGLTFNEAIEETPQNYLGKVYYKFTLRKTN